MGGGRVNRRERAVNASRPRTRGTKPKLADPITNTHNLNLRLKSLGLYAANTVGDGNCLFRALSDQLYGSPSKHAELRSEICDFIEARKSEYAGFIEDERGIDVHIRNMRQLGTYGGHVELSVFARLKRRDVKVVQPDVVYVIEHRGLIKDDDESAESSSATVSPKRRKDAQPPLPTTQGTIYVAYHDWEHFSSVRNIRGPHHGLPSIQEHGVEEEQEEQAPRASSVKVTISKHKLKALRGKVPTSALTKPTSPTTRSQSQAQRTQHALPTIAPPNLVDSAEADSRDSSPLTSQSSSSSAAVSGLASGSSAPSSLAPVTPPDGHEAEGRTGLEARLRSRLGVERLSSGSRSPKRSFGESDLENDGDDKDGSIDGRRTRRKPMSGMSNVSSASALSNVAPPPSSPEDLTIDDDQDADADADGDEDAQSVLQKLLDYGSDSSLSSPETRTRGTRTVKPRKAKGSKLKPLKDDDVFEASQASQLSNATGPPSSAPSSRQSPALDESQSTQEVISANIKDSTRPGKGNKEVKLTRRQKRALGLPKHGNGSGKGNVIVIPGGRHPSRLAIRATKERERMVSAVGDDDEESLSQEHEWERNGSGRKDARGFLILNI